MNSSDVRAKFLAHFKKYDHEVIPRAQLVPQNDPTTLFTGSGMQPLVPFLLGEEHSAGTRLVNSQTCFRAQDIEEVGDNRHTTFFEMLGNWSLGDFFKKDQIPWIWEFLIKEVKLDPSRIFITCFIGDDGAGVPRDTESAEIWTKILQIAGVDTEQVDIGSEEDGARLGDQGGRIFFYDSKKNWWSRAGTPNEMPVGEPGGPTTEMFYLFPDVTHDSSYGEKCHPNCDCGRYIELGNSVFMAYVKTENGIEKLPKQNVDYGGGLERIAAAAIDSSDVFKISLIWPIIEKLEKISGKTYESHTTAMRVIADHLRAATFLAVDGVKPSNKEQGYVMRRLMRRAIRYAFELGIEQNFLEDVVPVIADLYHDDYPEVAEKREEVISTLIREEKAFRQTLRKAVRVFERDILRMESSDGTQKPLITGGFIFTMYDTYGFPIELTLEEAKKRKIEKEEGWQESFEKHLKEQRERSQTAAKGTFKGGLGGQTQIHKKYHTATHLTYRALKMVLGDHVVQRGSNITDERLRFDFSHPEKMTKDQIAEVEKIVNDAIEKDYPMTWTELPTKVALEKGALGAFGDKYGDTVKVFQAGFEGEEPFSFEICGGPHVKSTKELAEEGKEFKITKEESSSAGVRRIKAVLS
jgi:alanyl-tRNA synthetase